MSDDAEHAAQVQAFLRSAQRRRDRDVILVMGALGGIFVATWITLATIPPLPAESEYEYIVRRSTENPVRYEPAGAVIAITPVGTPRSTSGLCDYPGRLSGVDRLRAAAGVNADVEVLISYTAFARSPTSGEVTLAGAAIHAAPSADSVAFTMWREALPDGHCQTFGYIAVRVPGCLLALAGERRSCNGRVVGRDP